MTDLIPNRPVWYIADFRLVGRVRTKTNDMKTPIQTAIEQIEAEMKIWESQTPSPVRGALILCREILKEQLAAEREAIEGAFYNGILQDDLSDITPQDYFNQKYNEKWER